MKQTVGLIILLGLIISLISNVKKPEPKQFPNPRSEMAIAMREMTHQILKTKVSFQSNQVKPLNFESFKDKQFTEEKFDTDWFNPLADLMMEQAATFDQDLSVESYNLVVQLCQSCHEHACPGPLVQIEQLFLTE